MKPYHKVEDVNAGWQDEDEFNSQLAQFDLFDYNTSFKYAEGVECDENDPLKDTSIVQMSIDVDGEECKFFYLDEDAIENLVDYLKACLKMMKKRREGLKKS